MPLAWGRATPGFPRCTPRLSSLQPRGGLEPAPPRLAFGAGVVCREKELGMLGPSVQRDLRRSHHPREVGGSHEGWGTGEAPHVETRQQKPQFPCASGPQPRGRDVMWDIPASCLHCWHVLTLARETGKSEHHLFLPDCFWAGARSVRGRPPAAEQPGMSCTCSRFLPWHVHAPGPGPCVAPLPACGTVGGGCALNQGKGFPQTTHSITLTLDSAPGVKV